MKLGARSKVWREWDPILAPLSATARKRIPSTVRSPTRGHPPRGTPPIPAQSVPIPFSCGSGRTLTSSRPASPTFHQSRPPAWPPSGTQSLTTSPRSYGSQPGRGHRPFLFGLGQQPPASLFPPVTYFPHRKKKVRNEKILHYLRIASEVLSAAPKTQRDPPSPRPSALRPPLCPEAPALAPVPPRWPRPSGELCP